MATLDVSDVLADPDFQSTVGLIRGAVTVDNRGVASLSVATATFQAVVVPAASMELNRLADADQLRGKLRIITRFPLVAGGQDANGRAITADMIVWQSCRYTVSSVDAYAFGVGFVDALAELLPVAGQMG